MAFAPVEELDLNNEVSFNEDFENQCCTKTSERRDEDGQLISSATVTKCLDDALYHGNSDRAMRGACSMAQFAAGKATLSIAAH